MRKPVFGVSDQVKDSHQTVQSQSLALVEISAIALTV